MTNRTLVSGSILQAYRKGLAKLSQVELARRLGISRATMIRLEKLPSLPTDRIEQLDRIFRTRDWRSVQGNSEWPINILQRISRIREQALDLMRSISELEQNVLSATSPLGIRARPKEFMLIEDVANRLHLHPESVRRLVRSKDIEAVRIGRRIGITENAIQVYLNQERR